MRLRTAILIIIGFIAVSLVTVAAQDRKSAVIDLDYDDGCGNPNTESQTYGWFRGRVTKIVDSNKVVLNNKFNVLLVGIDPAINRDTIRRFLADRVLGKYVSFSSNPVKRKGTNLRAVVRLFDGDFDEINEYLLENGIAKYQNFDSDYLVPFYWPCRLEKAEERAKNAELGIWANKWALNSPAPVRAMES